MTRLLAALIAAASLSAAMPPEQQNAIVQKYCAVCHTDAHPNGRLSLQHFDAAHADPGIAAMMLAKLRGGAMGAAGLGVPDRKVQDEFRDALTAEAKGSENWVVSRGEALSASIVRTVGEDLYRLQVTCGPKGRQTQLAWSPDVVPQSGREMLAAVDGRAPTPYVVREIEKNGNGMGVSGPGSVLLPTPLPVKTLTIQKLFRGETVEFPLSDLDPSAHRDLTACFDATIQKTQ